MATPPCALLLSLSALVVVSSTFLSGLIRAPSTVATAFLILIFEALSACFLDSELPSYATPALAPNSALESFVAFASGVADSCFVILRFGGGGGGAVAACNTTNGPATGGSSAAAPPPSSPTAPDVAAAGTGN